MSTTSESPCIPAPLLNHSVYLPGAENVTADALLRYGFERETGVVGAVAQYSTRDPTVVAALQQWLAVVAPHVML